MLAVARNAQVNVTEEELDMQVKFKARIEIE